MDAEELCRSAVRKTPASSPRIGLENKTNKFITSGTSANGFTASDIVSIPNINTAKPTKICARFFLFPLVENSKMPTPIIASTGAKEEGFKSLIQKFPLSMPDKLNIQDVTVVPILAPIITPIACESFIMPELTNPTTMTVAAEDD